jgi:hypothetical protein
MAARLWPHAWEILAALIVAAFGLLEDAAFRRHKHLTLSRVMHRWLAALGRWISRQLGFGPDDSCRWIGPAIFAAAWGALSVHFALIDADQQADAAHVNQEVPSCPHS